MQRIVHQYTNRSTIFMLIEQLYTYVSDTKQEFSDVVWLTEEFRPLVDILKTRILNFNTQTFKPANMPVLKYEKGQEKEVTVCISGGKDSAATALWFKQHGYKVHLYHVHGLNVAYPDEQQAATKIAAQLNIPLFVDEIRAYGPKGDYTEHPMKNYIIANGAIHYCLACGYAPCISFGNFTQASIADNDFSVCGGDCIEMWAAYENIIKSVIPDFKMLLPLDTNEDTFRTLKNQPKILEAAISCMSPFRFRKTWQHQVEQKFNTKLFQNNCGRCWKCAMENIWSMDCQMMDYNEALYIYSLCILAYTIAKEYKRAPVDMFDVWYHYMWYACDRDILGKMQICESGDHIIVYKDYNVVFVSHKVK